MAGDNLYLISRLYDGSYFPGLSRSGMEAMSKLRSAPEVAHSLIKLVGTFLSIFSRKYSSHIYSIKSLIFSMEQLRHCSNLMFKCDKMLCKC